MPRWWSLSPELPCCPPPCQGDPGASPPAAPPGGAGQDDSLENSPRKSRIWALVPRCASPCQQHLSPAQLLGPLWQTTLLDNAGQRGAPWRVLASLWAGGRAHVPAQLVSGSNEVRQRQSMAPHPSWPGAGHITQPHHAALLVPSSNRHTALPGPCTTWCPSRDNAPWGGDGPPRAPSVREQAHCPYNWHRTHAGVCPEHPAAILCPRGPWNKPKGGQPTGCSNVHGDQAGVTGLMPALAPSPDSRHRGTETRSIPCWEPRRPGEGNSAQTQPERGGGLAVGILP